MVSELGATLWMNFGQNITVTPEFYETPHSEAEVLALLRRHRGREIRAVASRHAWSRVAVANGVMVDVGRINSVEIQEAGTEPTAIVGAGCQIKRLVAELGRAGWTTPSIGLITEQTIAGATSTATHGSGRHCLSNYIRAMRVATYDEGGKPVIREITGGFELEAARCALGQMGIVTSITISIRRQFAVEEHFSRMASLEAVLAAEAEYPLQQFFFLPWDWGFFGQHRRESTAPRSFTAGLYRWFWSLGMDRGLHWIVILLSRWLPDRCTPLFFRWGLPLLVPRGWRVVDRSDKQLTMGHHLYRHIETEVFVTRSQLEPMLKFCRWLLEWSAGQHGTLPTEWDAAINASGQQSNIEALRGQYRHHYPICVRKILPDQGLITMSSGGSEAWYSVSFISYARPADRAGFFCFSDVLIHLSGILLNARPHWGKYTPLPPPNVETLYPQLPEFRRVRDQIDPTGAFRAPWL